jgi:tRNA A37 methylthiotransferase MiaB
LWLIVGNKQAADQVMRRATEEEAQHARAIKSIDENDVPLVPVVVDGCWSKRSYNTNYNALSGAAAIIGQHTGYETNMYVLCFLRTL